MTTAAAGTTPPKQRRIAFTTLFLVEMWERFGYYGMTAVVLLYMVQKLGYTDDRANLTFGAFTALVYAAPAVGGWIGDRVLGSRRMTVLGALVLALGYVLLAIPNGPLFAALGVVAVGNGLFKANPANLVSKVYEGEPSKIDSAFTLYYMAVNVGATFSQILTPLIAIWAGWNAAFGVCAGGHAALGGELLRHAPPPRPRGLAAGLRAARGEEARRRARRLRRPPWSS